MEHIPIPPGDLAHDIIHIPLRCNKQYTYDDLGFLSYPKRMGIDPNQLQNDNDPSLSLSDASPFIQAWLWFGLLGEVLYVGSRSTTAPKVFHSDEFVQIRNGRSILSTQPLYRAIYGRSKKGNAFLYREWHQDRVESSLRTAADFTRNAVNTTYFRDILESGLAVDDLPDIFLSILAVRILCQTIEASIPILFPQCGKRTVLDTGPCSPLVDYLLLKSGWGGQEILELPRDVCIRYHLSFYRQKGHLKHSVSKEPVMPFHTEECSGCDFYMSPTSERRLPANSLHIALFTFQHLESGPCRLDMHLYTLEALENTSYIAISHPRPMGLGNDSDNSLPCCQLSRIQARANQLLSATTSSTSASSAFPNVPFWIDTLSLPLEQIARRSTLNMAQKIFNRATSVLVMDPSLFQHSILSLEEAFVRISYSYWKKRLWTIQEGACAKSLHFCFSNHTVSLDDLLANHVGYKRGPEKYDILPGLIPSSLTQVDWRTTAKMINEFLEDIRTWLNTLSDSNNHESIPGPLRKQDKFKFQKCLRVGYLVGGKLVCFADKNERSLFSLVYECIHQVYGPSDSEGNLPDVIRESPDAVLARLESVLVLTSDFLAL